MQPTPVAQSPSNGRSASEQPSRVGVGEKRRSRSPSADEATPAKRHRSEKARPSTDPVDTLDARITRATELLNAEQPRQALAILAPVANTEAAKGHYGFQSRLGNAYMGVVDELVAANRLGSFLVTADDVGSWLNANVHAERISCYLGVLGAYGTLMQLLQLPAERAKFVEKNGAETLELVEGGVRAGLTHAMIEPVSFLTRICQINSNNASRDFVNQSIARGTLSADDQVVLSFRQVEADPLYEPIVAACAGVNQAARDSGQAPQMFWFSWAQEKKQKLFALPVYQLAMQYAA